MAVALAQLRTQHTQAREKVVAQLAGLDAQRPALALDGDPADLAELDEGRLRLQLEADRHDLALEEIVRREEAEATAQAELTQKALRSQMRSALASRAKNVSRCRDLADALSDALDDTVEDDAKAFSLARTLELDGTLRPIVPAIAEAIFARLQVLQPRGVPYVKDSERADELLQRMLDVKPAV
jgi:hypothetical protein